MANLIRTKTLANHPSSSSSATAALSRPSNAAGDAAAAAEFAEKKYVWIPDKQDGYLAAWVVREEQEGEISVCSLTDGQVSRQSSQVKVRLESANQRVGEPLHIDRDRWIWNQIR